MLGKIVSYLLAFASIFLSYVVGGLSHKLGYPLFVSQAVTITWAVLSLVIFYFQGRHDKFLLGRFVPRGSRTQQGDLISEPSERDSFVYWWNWPAGVVVLPKDDCACGKGDQCCRLQEPQEPMVETPSGGCHGCGGCGGHRH